MFNFYWEIRDFWNFRWINKVEMQHIKTRSVKIPISWDNKNNFLYSDIYHTYTTPKDSPVVIFTHGFSDDRKYTRFLTIPITLAGYDVVSYDCRGTQGSRKAGNKNQFVEIKKDLGDVIKFIQNLEEFQNRPIYLVGISLGAMASINQGLYFDNVKKIIAVASFGNYREILPRSPIPFKMKWWIWLRFKIFGVIFNPLDEVNIEISPALQLTEAKKRFENNDEWESYINKKLFLIHAKNDKIIPISHFYENIKIAGLKEANWMVTKKGGHMFRKYEVILSSSILSFLQIPLE
jgi:pimeloyl-ACP methyl ester carboxylesterase